MDNIISNIQLQKYRPLFLNALKEFELPVEKAQYTSLPVEVLERLTDDQYPIVILNGDEPVGFFLLQATDRVKEFTHNQNAFLLTSLSIDHSQQGKGFAKKAMTVLHDFMKQHFPQCDEIILAVNHRNIPAQALYKKVGFNDTGKRKIGKIGEQFIFNLLI